MTTERDVLTPKEVSARSGFSYGAVLRAIRLRGELAAFEPIRPTSTESASRNTRRWAASADP